MFDAARWEPRGRIIMALAFIVLLYVYPAERLIGIGLYFLLALILFRFTSNVRLPISLLYLFIPTLTLFGLGPWFLAIAGFDHGDAGAELLFGGAVVLKAGTAVLMTWALLASMNDNSLLWALRQLKVPTGIVFMLMIALRYFHSLARSARQLSEAAGLRRFNRPVLRGMVALVSKLVLEAVTAGENIYIAVRLRGGRLVLPLLASNKEYIAIPHVIMGLFIIPLILWLFI